MSAQRDRAVHEEATRLARSGAVPAAIEMLRDHLRRSRNDHANHALLAQLLTMLRQTDEAEPLLLRAIRGDRRNPMYLVLHAELLMTVGRHAEALTRQDQALKIDPTLEAALAGKAETYLRMGKPEKAAQVLEHAPDTPVTAVGRARALTRMGRVEDAIAVCRRHVPATGAPHDVQRGLWYALGQACMRAGQIDDAAQAFTHGNALSASDWSDESDRDGIERLKAVFSADAVPSLPRAQCDSTLPVFVVGLPRCGSTLIEQIIAAHPDAAGAGELEDLPAALAGMQDRLGARLPWPELLREVNEDGLTAMSQAYLKVLGGIDESAIRIVDKQLSNIWAVGLIALLFPEARVIHCRRHPLDLGVSAWTQKFPPGTNAWASSLEHIGQAYLHGDELMAHWTQVLPIRMLSIRYEEMVSDLEGTVRTMLDFCDLPFDGRCLRFWETGRTVLTLSSDQVRQPLYDKAVGRHDIWGRHLDPLRETLGATLAEYEAG